MSKIVYVVRTHVDHWDNDEIVAKFYSLDDAFAYIASYFKTFRLDCFSISMEHEKK